MLPSVPYASHEIFFISGRNILFRISLGAYAHLVLNHQEYMPLIHYAVHASGSMKGGTSGFIITFLSIFLKNTNTIQIHTNKFKFIKYKWN